MNRAYLFQSRGHKRRGKYIKTISVMGVLFMNKVYTLHDAVAKFVESGDCICFGGFTTNRKPYAAVGEILRQGQKDFTVWAGPAGGDWDMMIGEGRVKAYINCYTANSGYTNVSRRFRAAIEKGAATAELFAIPFREQMGRAKSVPDDRYAAVYADMAREMEEQIADIAARGGAEE